MDTLMVWRSVVLLLSVMALLAESQTKAPLMCATGTFTEGSLGFIECLFNRNINTTDSRYHFNVVHYPASNQSKTVTGNPVLLCNWRQGELECKTGVADGYSFDNKVSDRLTVSIEAVSEKHAGLYSCQVLPDDDIPVQTCTLRVKARTNTTSEPSPALPPHGADSNHTVVGLVVALCVCLVTIGILLVYLKRRGWPSSKRDIVDGVSCCRNANSAEAGEVNKVKTRLDRESEIAVEVLEVGLDSTADIASQEQPDMPLLEVQQTPVNPLTTQNQRQRTPHPRTHKKRVQATAARAHAETATAKSATRRGTSDKGGASADETPALTREKITELNDQINQVDMELRKGGCAEVAKLRAELATLGMAAKEGVEAAGKVKALETDKKKLAEENEALKERYKSELLLRKKYYNMMEDMKGKIRVYCRVRPMSSGEKDKGNVSVVQSPDTYSIAVQTKSGLKDFQFNKVFMQGSTQEEVFEDTINLIQSAVDGYNVCIFAYGQTGSGKTFTIIGDQAGEFPGIAPRAFQRIFELADGNKGKIEMTVTAYMLELYNDKLIDLFTMKDTPEIKQDKKGFFFIQGAVVKSASNAKELNALFEEGFKSRHTASTQMNAESSRSHLIVGVVMESTDRATGNVVRGKLSLVDLAGSEPYDKTPGASDEIRKEGIAIKTSLSVLSKVILALSEKKPVIPYRESKLTMLLQDSLGGKAKTLMFVNISPADNNADETVASLGFAERLKVVTNDASKNATM